MNPATTYDDPLPVESEGNLEKFVHVHEIGKDVRIRATGHVGKLTNISSNRYYVTLPTGHVVACKHDEIQPADFPAHAADVDAALFPEEAPTPIDAGTKALLAGFMEGAGGLMRAFESGRVTGRDRQTIRDVLERVKKHGSASISDPFGEREDDDVRLLKIFAEKYADADGGTVTKASGALAVGDRVREQSSSRIGTVKAISSGLVHVRYEDGTEGSIAGSHVEGAPLTKRAAAISAYHPGQKVRMADGRAGVVSRCHEYAPHCVEVTLPGGVVCAVLPEDVEPAAA